jgi:hypothetical protein
LKEDFAGSGVDDGTDDGYKVPVAVDFDLGDGLSGFVIGVGDEFDLAAKDGEGRGGHLLGFTDWTLKPALFPHEMD